MLAVILAGGKGTRIKEYDESLPKPMLSIAGKPILQWQIESLKSEGVYDFLLVVCYKYQKIADFFGDGSEFGVKIKYFIEPEPMGTAGALFKIELPDEFLLINGDLIFDFTLEDMLSFHRQKQALITLFTHPSSHPFDSSAVFVDKNSQVMALEKNKENSFSNLSNAGIQIVNKKAFLSLRQKQFMLFDKDVVRPNIENGSVYSYCCSEYCADVGTPERFQKAEKDLLIGLPEKFRNHQKRKAVFLDRDGTINQHKGYIFHPSQIELIPGVANAINTFHGLGYLVIIITNQPVVARGECSEVELETIHNRLIYLLAKQGAYIDDIYYCPHHPDSGFEGENKAYKIDCECRKPKPGMIFEAADKWNIDLKQSFMAGDSLIDVQTAINSGCQPVIVGNIENSENALTYHSLNEFAKALEKDERIIK